MHAAMIAGSTLLAFAVMLYVNTLARRNFGGGL